MSSRTAPPGQDIPLAPLQSLLAGRRRRRPLIAPHLIGFKTPPRLTRARRRALTDAELREAELGRAFLCGARYSCWGWKRRDPPRYRCGSRSGPDHDHLLACGQAFFRGYDAATRARYAWSRDWQVHQLVRTADG